MVELIGLPELAGEFSRRRSDGCTVHLPLRRQATPLHPPNLRRGEMFPRSALFKHRLLTSERREQVDMIWHNDRIGQNRPVTFEMEQSCPERSERTRVSSRGMILQPHPDDDPMQRTTTSGFDLADQAATF
jgi:hypothetical protein